MQGFGNPYFIPVGYTMSFLGARFLLKLKRLEFRMSKSNANAPTFEGAFFELELGRTPHPNKQTTLPEAI